MTGLAKLPWTLIAAGGFAIGMNLALWQWRDTHVKLSELRAGYAELVTSHQQCSLDLDAERRNASAALAAQIAADREAVRLSAELDAARVAADEARGRVVTRTVEVIRNATSLSACGIPDDVRDARLRQWCSADPERTDNPHCDGSTADE